jgi:hypothetical protein
MLIGGVARQKQNDTTEVVSFGVIAGRFLVGAGREALARSSLFHA